MSDEDTTAQDEDVEAHKLHRGEKQADLNTDANTEEPPDVEGHVLPPRQDHGRHDHGKHEL